MDHHEIWMPIPGYSYEISNIGRVKSLPNAKRKSTKILSPPLDRDGYRTIILCKDGAHRRHKVHHLVATAFIRARMDGEEIDHINGNRQDNRVENLRWVLRKTNMRTESTRASMSAAKTKQSVVCVETGEVFESAYDASRKTGLSRCQIRMACIIHSRTAGHKHWKYKGER